MKIRPPSRGVAKARFGAAPGGAWRALAMLALAGGSATAQEALRTAVQADRAGEARAQNALLPPPAMHWGPVHLELGASVALKWTDNVRISQGSQEADFSVRPQVNLGAMLPISRTSRISAGVGIGYEKYFELSQYDSFVITPDSTVALDIPVKDFVFTIYDSVSYSQDVVSEPDLSNRAQYPRLENTVGLRANWRPADWLWQVGYSHVNFIPFADESGVNSYSRLERASEQFYGRGAHFLAEATQVGVEATGSLTAYSSGERSDYQTVSLGPFVDWTLTEYLRITARGGYTMQFFDENGLFPAPDDTDSYYLGLSVSHQLTQAISHDLSGQHGLDTGIDAQSVQRTSLGYGIRWRFMDPLTASFNTSVEIASETQTAFGAGEDYTRLGFGCGLSYAMTDHLSTSIGYQYYQRASDLERNNYDQNQVTLMIGYRF